MTNIFLTKWKKINQLKTALNKDYENFIKENNDKQLEVEDEK